MCKLRRRETPIPAARVFIARSQPRTIVVTLHESHDGIGFEDAMPVVLDPPVDAELLGLIVREKMSATTRQRKDFRSTKLSDWPAYRASKARSMRQFQEEYIGIEVRAANKENLVAVITGTPEPDAELEVLSSVSTAFPDQIGERILSVYEACRDRRL